MSPKTLLIQVLRRLLRPVVLEIMNSDIRVWGDPSRLKIARTAHMVNTLFNVYSGDIEVGEFTFTGHNVAILTGTHDYECLMQDRMLAVPRTGRDIKIGRGVWIGTNAIILGPCTVGDHAVIAAGSIVRGDVAPYSIVAGSPARHVGLVTPSIATGVREQTVRTT